MRTASKLILATLAATALLALAAGGASARTLSVNERNFEFIWSNALTGKTKLEFFDAAERILACNVTFLGGFTERTIAKVVGAKIGAIRHAEREGCGAGEAQFMGLPWEVRYRGFTGRLPVIETLSIGIVGLITRIREPGFNIECTATTTAAEPAVFILEEIAAGAVESIRAEPAARIALGGMPPCEVLSPMHFAGKGLVRNLPRTAKIVLTLI